MEIAAIIFIIVMFGAAYVVFRILKRTVKLAIRTIIALIIILAAVAGGALLLKMEPGFLKGNAPAFRSE